MPLLRVQTSAPAPGDAGDLLRDLSARIASLLGKPERYVMTALESEVPMTFAGDGETPVCFLEVKSVGRLSPTQTAAISAELCPLLAARLDLPQDRIYIEFTPAEGHLWGWNGGTFG
jgi:phenylpyruvate tautomerase PptA (4-oxalocrotonate tautomerase family)